jgi:hypothetical protein
VKITVVRKGLASLSGVLLLAAAISVAGCATYSPSGVQPSDAANILRVGDEVEITRKDDTTAYFKIKEISSTEVSGSLLTNMFGRNVSIPFSDIDSITLYTKDGHDVGEAFEALSYLLILWPFFL